MDSNILDSVVTESRNEDNGAESKPRVFERAASTISAPSRDIIKEKQGSMKLTDADRASLRRLHRSMVTALQLHWAAIFFTLLRYISRSLEGWIEGKQVLDPAFAFMGVTECLVLLGLATALQSGAGKVKTAAECKDGSAVKVLVGLASNLDVVFDNLKVAWTVQGMVYIMYLAVFNPGTMVGTAVLAAIVLIERVVMMLWPRYPYRSRAQREGTLNPIVVMAQVITPEAPTLDKMLEASQEGGVKKVTPERAAMERHTYLLPGQVAVFAQVVGDLIMTGGAEGRLLFASLIEVAGCLMSGSYAMAIIPVVGTYGYYCERQAILGTAAALEELLDAEGTVDEMVEVYGGKKGDEVPFLGSESPSVTYLFRCLGETAVTIGLNHAVFGIWGIVQVLNYDTHVVNLYNKAVSSVMGVLGWSAAAEAVHAATQ